MKNVWAFVLFAVIAWLSYGFFQSDRTPIPALVRDRVETSRIAPTSKSLVPPPVKPVERFSCDGRKRCPQMSSCAEAIWFLEHCPGTEMDGDRDGIPCEQQWCK